MSSDTDKRFSIPQTPNEDQSWKIKLINEKVTELAALIDEICPISREKALALTHLEISSFYVDASILRNS
jgi:hypothetical protein